MKLNTKTPGYVILYAAVTSAVFTAGIMAVHVATEGRVERNERLARDRAIVELFNLGDPAPMEPEEVTRLVEGLVREHTLNPGTDQEARVLVAYRSVQAARAGDLRDKRNVRGYAFEVSGVGFWARIEGLLAVTPDLERILGIVFLRHSETPGLGGRISTEKAWRDSFRGLSIAPQEGMKFIYIDHTRPEKGQPRASRHVDALTGATGTSAAVETFLNERIARFRAAAAAAGLISSDASAEGQGE